MHDSVTTVDDTVFEWDDDKAAGNLRKHGVAFEHAEQVWDDPAHITVFDRHEENAGRLHAMCLVRGILILIVVHSFRAISGKDVICISRARKATKDEEALCSKK